MTSGICLGAPFFLWRYLRKSSTQFWRPQRTLQNCALTCRAWVPRCQLNLFRCIIVAPTGAEQLYRLARILDDSPHLREFVHEIKVSMSKRKAEKQLIGREAFEVLPILLSGKVPALRTLRVSAVNKNASALILYPSFFATLPQLRSITTLELYHVTFARFGELARMLSILVNLRFLKCNHVRWQACLSISVELLRCLQHLTPSLGRSQTQRSTWFAPLLAVCTNGLGITERSIDPGSGNGCTVDCRPVNHRRPKRRRIRVRASMCVIWPTRLTFLAHMHRAI